MKRNEPRRHHYVPEVYQRGFVDSDERLWVYDRKLRRYAKIHPRNVCCENFLYTIDPEGIQDQQIESQWLSRVDGEAATAIRMFGSRVQLDQEWRESFSIFIAQLITRAPAFRDLTHDNFRAMGDEFLRLGFSDVERAKNMLENYGKETGESHDSVSPESLVQAVASGEIKLTVTERPFLEHMLRQVEFLAKWMASFNWQVLVAPQGTGFILCDYPFVLVPPSERPENIGLAFPGTGKYFPLTKTLCLRMGEPGYEFSYRSVSKVDVRIINQNIAVNSERFIMGPSRTQLEHVIARSKTALPAESRVQVQAVERSSDDALYRFSFWPRRRFFYPAP